MCGIFCYINNNNNNTTFNTPKLLENFNKIGVRGPDNSQYIIKNNIFLGFHRLCINDLTNVGNQPMKYKDYYLICNGEIFNHLNIKDTFRFKPTSNSDCEIILHLYDHLINDNVNYNVNDNVNDNVIHKLCNHLDGEFSFILYDSKLKKIYIARDPYGVRPLFIGTTENNDYVFSSELKGMNNLVKSSEQFIPGSYMILDNTLDNKLNLNYHKYHKINYNKLNFNNELIYDNLNKVFRKAVYKRMMSDKEICSLLSGGLDSSLVAAIVSDKLGPYKLKTFSIGIKGSPDLKYAKIVADHIKSIHYSIELSEKEFLDAIETVIVSIESYDTTTVRASVGNYLVSKYIKDNTDCKVVFNGDYADEVCGGYKYFKKTDNDEMFHNECIRLLNDIHYFDCLRSDRSISNNGLEARVPFADKDFVNYYLSINPELRKSFNNIEKYTLRQAFSKDNLLPDAVLWRSKEAFSDGITSETRSWHTIIKEFVDLKISDEYFEKNKNKYEHNIPILKESFYYREIFEKHYNGFSNVIPYFWMPLWCDETNDPSARSY
jgi:asparagine synthase (glutamine-hydrolysing)